MNEWVMTVAYHGTQAVDEILREGLLRSRGRSFGCPTGHVCLSETPQLAADYGTVIEVDLTDLALPEEGFFNGEMRLHEDISPQRLSPYPHPVRPANRPFVDPLDPFYATREGQHPTCVRIREQG